MKKSKKVAGIILIAVSIIGMLFWENWGRDNMLYDEVLVLKNDLEKHQIISKDMLTTRRIDKSIGEALKPGDYESIVGKESVQFIKGQTQLFQRYFSETELVVDGESSKFIMAIPNSWLESYPQTLRRGDRAYFYTDGKLVTSAIVAFAKDGTNQEVVSKDEKRLEASSTISLIEIVVDDSQSECLTNLAGGGQKFVIMYN